MSDTQSQIVTEEALDDIFRRTPEPDVAASDQPSAGEPEVGEESGEEPPPTPDSPDADTEQQQTEAEEAAFIDLMGRKLAREEAQSLAEFYDWARANPQAINAFDQYLRGDADLVPRQQGAGQQAVSQSRPSAQSPADAPSQEEEDEDLADLPASVRAKLAKIDQLDAYFTQQAERQAQEQLQTAQSAVVKAAEGFQSKHGLTDEDMAELQTVTANLGVLPTLAAKSGDMISAVEQAFNLAYWSTDKFRDRAIQAQQQQAATDKSRQRKAASLSGSSGSVPRLPKAANAGDRREAMVAELRSALNGGTE